MLNTQCNYDALYNAFDDILVLTISFVLVSFHISFVFVVANGHTYDHNNHDSEQRKFNI